MKNVNKYLHRTFKKYPKLEYGLLRCRAVHLYHPECSRRIAVKFNNPSPLCGIC
jgi:hypothetical protein